LCLTLHLFVRRAVVSHYTRKVDLSSVTELQTDWSSDVLKRAEGSYKEKYGERCLSFVYFDKDEGARTLDIGFKDVEDFKVRLRGGGTAGHNCLFRLTYSLLRVDVDR
jgi:hypothetical protein